MASPLQALVGCAATTYQSPPLLLHLLPLTWSYKRAIIFKNLSGHLGSELINPNR